MRGQEGRFSSFQEFRDELEKYEKSIRQFFSIVSSKKIKISATDDAAKRQPVKYQSATFKCKYWQTTDQQLKRKRTRRNRDVKKADEAGKRLDERPRTR